MLLGPVEKLGRSSNCFQLDLLVAERSQLRTVRTNSVGALVSPSQEEGELEPLDSSRDPVADALLVAVG